MISNAFSLGNASATLPGRDYHPFNFIRGEMFARAAGAIGQASRR
jgi:hypothetical protein